MTSKPSISGICRSSRIRSKRCSCVQAGDLARLLGRRDVGVALIAQHLLEQHDIRFLVVDDQDAGIEYFGDF